MSPFRVQMLVYVMAESEPDALRRCGWLTSAVRENAMVPAGARVFPVTESDIKNSRPLQRLVDRYTQPEHGVPATGVERRRLVRALAAANGGDLTAGETIVKTLEQGAGYLPRSIAHRLLELHPLPARAVA